MFTPPRAKHLSTGAGETRQTIGNHTQKLVSTATTELRLEIDLTELQHRLNQGEIIILDGATATEVEKRGVPLHDLTWSAYSLLTHPEIVREVHRTYIEAGADIITTNTYATNRNVLAPAGMGGDVQRLNALAVTLAREAREQSATSRPVLIAGSISTESARPGFYFGRGRLDLQLPTEQQARANYREQAEIMAEAGAELIVLEMMRDIPQTTYALEAALSTGLPVWVGFSTRMSGDGSRVLLQDSPEEGPTLADALEAIRPLGCSVVSVMHTTARETTPALAELRRHWQGPTGAYPNSTGTATSRWDLQDTETPESLLAEAREWVKMGVQIIGGCCGIGPEHIRAFREGLPDRLP